MSSQLASANLSKNKFGNGANISIKVTNSSKKGNEEKSQSSSMALVINDSDDENNKTLVQWLTALHLFNIYNKLKELGVEDIEDMTLLDEEDLNSLELKKIKMKKLKRAIAKIKIE